MNKNRSAYMKHGFFAFAMVFFAFAMMFSSCGVYSPYGAQTGGADSSAYNVGGSWSKLGEFSGAQEAWQDWSAVFKGYAGAAVPRLPKLMEEAMKAEVPIPNATILEEDDRAASARLYWMLLMICKGAALNIVFLAGDSESLEAWRLLT